MSAPELESSKNEFLQMTTPNKSLGETINMFELTAKDQRILQWFRDKAYNYRNCEAG
jgi:hypothetical protein